MKIEIIKLGNELFFHIVAKNGKVLCQSGTYSRKRNAVEAAELIRYGVPGAEIVERGV